jgi:hypothetical protein
MAAIAGMKIIEIVLAAERDADGDFVRSGKRLEIAACLIAPSAAADDQNGFFASESSAWNCSRAPSSGAIGSGV